MATKSNIFFSAIIIISLTGISESYASDIAPTEYQIQPGDVLDVSVWKEEDLTKSVLVRPDGAISFPLVGDLTVTNKSPAQVASDLSQKIKQFIPEPVITVSVQQISGNQVFVIGKVNRPGPFLATRYLDVTQALSMAGGTSTYAAVNKIKILRRNENGQQKAISFEYGDIEKGKNLDQNIILRAGDVVIVP